MASRAKIVSPLPNADLSALLIVSIDHICTSTAQLLESEANGTSHTIMLTIANWGNLRKRADGWFMWVPHDIDHDENIPADLYHLFAYANRAGADYLLIDIDADTNPDLPVYPEE